MKISVLLLIPGEPVAQGRPRFRKHSNFVSAYDPKESKDYKEMVKQIASQSFSWPPIENAIRFKLDIYVKIPKSFSKAKSKSALEGAIRPSKRPDWDNYAKGVADALSGVCYVDDGQIVTATVNKYYSDEPRVEVTIEEV
jgi:Holliday junction resolvase RusA-like endonuclease